jgi:LL-diaminopimelate aminotransferase
MGSPDLPPTDFIIETLITAAKRPDMHGYGESGGSEALRLAISKYYFNRFQVELDHSREVLGLIGSKEGLFNLSQVLIDPGDLVLVPDPFYPVYHVGATVAQAETFDMPLLAKNDFLPDFSLVPVDVARKAKLMWLNYPNNPTGAIAPLSFFEEAVQFAKEFDIVIAHDAPYVDVCFESYVAPSILQVKGAKEVTVEFNSLSKTYNMAGWRIGIAVGNADIIKLLRTYKSQFDSSNFKPIMAAAETALLGDQTWISERNMVYQHRRDAALETLQELGFTMEPPKASLYIWARLPEGYDDSMAFCSDLLQATGVSVTPGNVYGKSGAGYIRISLVIPVDQITKAMIRMKEWMNKKDL